MRCFINVEDSKVELIVSEIDDLLKEEYLFEE